MTANIPTKYRRSIDKVSTAKSKANEEVQIMRNRIILIGDEVAKRIGKIDNDILPYPKG